MSANLGKFDEHFYRIDSRISAVAPKETLRVGKVFARRSGNRTVQIRWGRTCLVFGWLSVSVGSVFASGFWRVGCAAGLVWLGSLLLLKDVRGGSSLRRIEELEAEVEELRDAIRKTDASDTWLLDHQIDRAERAEAELERLRNRARGGS